MVLIYTKDKNGIPYYVGKTNRKLRLRSNEHKEELSVLDEVSNENGIYWERYWIEQLTQWGFKLTNKNKGGGGVISHSSLSRKKIGESMKGQKRPSTSKKLKGQKITWDLGTSIPILQFDLDGNLIAEHASMGKASVTTGIPTSAICNVCKGNYRQTHNFLFVYKDKWDGNPPKMRDHKAKGKPSNAYINKIKAPLSN